jgi:hypothetical protein
MFPTRKKPLWEILVMLVMTGCARESGQPDHPGASDAAASPAQATASPHVPAAPSGPPVGAGPLPSAAEAKKIPVASEFPVTLSLKDHAALPADPRKTVPELVYEKGNGLLLSEARWLAVLWVLENGEKREKTITWENGQETIPIPGEKGLITAQHGNWQRAISMYFLFASPKGSGTMKIALFDPAKFDQQTSAKTGAGQISNWLAIPIAFATE